MKRVLIICAAGMSSSLIAKKATHYFEGVGKEIEVEAIHVASGVEQIMADEFDLYLVSPQTKMHVDKLKEATLKKDKPLGQIPQEAYIPIPAGIGKLAAMIEQMLGLDG